MTRIRAALRATAIAIGDQLDERTVTGLAGLAALAAGVTINWGIGWTLTCVGALVLAIAIAPVIGAIRPGRREL